MTMEGVMGPCRDILGLGFWVLGQGTQQVGDEGGFPG